jgi:preprotein translocase subunit SecA
MSVFSKVLHVGEGKRLKELQQLVGCVNDFEPHIKALSDAELAAKTDEFRRRLADGASVDDIECEAFAVVREAAWRVLGQRHYDVQIIGAGALHLGMIAEMRTGEGKTLVSTMPSYLNGLAGNGVHMVTVNDYLARRDADWMGNVHRFLGLTVGLIQAEMQPAERRPAYQSDITYGTNNEFGFDYLRDNMAMRVEDMAQRGQAFAIVDEVDSILIDEARTPLIISGRVGETGKWYRDFARIAQRLDDGQHYEVDEKKHQVITTEDGVTRVEQILGIENMYDFANVDLIHHLDVALKAKSLYRRDVDYLVRDGEVSIVDEFTGRVLVGRRYSEGLHQAIEAKEGVNIKEENQTLATITIQNYFRMYEKLAGMTGTAITQQGEFKGVYDLDVIQVPTNRDIIRLDGADLIYVDEGAKYDALLADIVDRHEYGQPVLVGTVSIEKSELVSEYLTKNGVPHQVLNAKQHEREAHVIAQAGEYGAVTVATNMAGRGVDIMLGANPEELAKQDFKKRGVSPDSDQYADELRLTVAEFKLRTDLEKEKVIEQGGLYVLGTERHESRRIDNQLRGRSGRQGDPGESRFYLSLEDDLMRRFASGPVEAILRWLKIPRDMPIEHKRVSAAIEKAQSQVEAQNFEIRKNVLKYDEVMNTQREIVYRWRNMVLDGDGTDDLIAEWRDEVVENVVLDHVQGIDPSEWQWGSLIAGVNVVFPTKMDRSFFEFPDDTGEDEVVEAFIKDAEREYERRVEQVGGTVLAQLARTVVMSIIDNKWREHLAEMDYLRAGIGLRAMGQKDPLVEYQREGFDLFTALVDAVKTDTIRYLFHVQVVQEQQPARPRMVQTNAPGITARRKPLTVKDKIGRNEACPCGSGKKYKLCHGKPGAEPLAG